MLVDTTRNIWSSYRSCRAHFFLFHAATTTDIYPLSLHDALPICAGLRETLQLCVEAVVRHLDVAFARIWTLDDATSRSEEHTSELQSHVNLVCRLLLEKKNQR